MEGWKFVKEGTLESVVVPQSQGGIVYAVGKWVQGNREAGPLCVFDTREHARQAQPEVMGYTGIALYRCQYEPSPCPLAFTLRGVKVKRAEELPKGTRLATAVRLEEKVEG